VVVNVKQGWLRPLLLGTALVALGLLLAGAIPSLNPFGTETKDRSGPAVLKSIEKLSEYRAATANLQVIVDVEKDAKLLPSFIKGEKVLLVAGGRVDAAVDFSALDADALKIDGTTITITLPPPTLTEPQLDLDATRVYDRDRGLVDRFESVFEDSPTDDRELLQLAEEKLLAAAREDGQVLEAAQENTTRMLESLMHGLGFERVIVRYASPGT